MKTHFGIMFALGVLCTLLVSCGDDGEGRKPNIFGDEESFVRVEYTSNADTVYLRWTLTDKDTRFDSYEVTDNRTGRVVTAGREATSCFLTHIPYAEPVSVYLSLVQDGKTVKTNRTDLVIDGLDRVTAGIIIPDGLDRVTAGIIIPDRGSVTGGDGMYSVALPDGRSVFLMGDSYTGTVTGGRRSTSDHMYRNSYIVYDDGLVSALVDANGPGTSGAVPPGVTNEGQKWYWPGHGFVADNPPEDAPNPILDYIMGSDVSLAAAQETADRVTLSYSKNVQGNEIAFSPLNVAFGNSYILPIILAVLTAPENSLLIIENPEAHLHPSAQFRTGQLLALAAEHGIQIIVETHSDHLLNGVRVMAKAGMEGKGRTDAGKVEIHYIYQDKDHPELHLNERIVLEEDGTLDHWPQGFFDEWELALRQINQP